MEQACGLVSWDIPRDGTLDNDIHGSIQEVFPIDWQVSAMLPGFYVYEMKVHLFPHVKELTNDASTWDTEHFCTHKDY